jgi:hypothetical protein
LSFQQVLAQVLGLADQALTLGQERIHSAGKTALKDLGELVEEGPHRLQLLPGCCQFPLERIPLPCHRGRVRRETGEIFGTLRPPPGGSKLAGAGAR